MQPDEKEIKSFYQLLETELKDTRGKQGLKHYLPFVLLSYVLGLILLRSNRSSVHRFMKNRFKWLCSLTGHAAPSCISYAQLGRVLRETDPEPLNELSIRFFNTKIEKLTDLDWIAGDGKDLKGSFDANQSASRGDVLVRAITHKAAQECGSCFYQGNKDCEINAMRHLVTHKGLMAQNMTLDALHCNADTTQLFAQNGGHYIVRVKAKHQKELVKDLTSKIRRLSPLVQFEDIEKGHGRIETRAYACYHIQGECFEKRWQKSHLTTCIVVNRRVEQLQNSKKGKISHEQAFYISNAWLSNAPVKDKTVDKVDKKTFEAKSICIAVRKHWAIEADNYIRDVTLNEDKRRCPKSNTAKTTTILTSIALQWLKLFKPNNFKELAEILSDKSQEFKKN